MIDESTTQTVRYVITEAEIKDKFAPYLDLKADTPKGYEQVRLAIAHCRETRVAIENRRTELKADALEYGRLVDSTAKRLTELLVEVEEPLKAKKKEIDSEKERIKAAIEEAKRQELEAKVRAERQAEEARLKAIRDEEAARLKVENERLAAERARFAEEQRVAKAKADADRAEQDAKEKAERAAHEAKVKAEWERIETARLAAKAEREAEEARVATERKKLDDERRAIQAAKEKAEREEFERQATIKAEQQAKARAEQDRIEAENRRVADQLMKEAEAARLEAIKPDLLKFAEFAEKLREIKGPTVKSDEAKAWLSLVIEDIHGAANRLDEFICDNEA